MDSVSQANFRNCNYVMCLTYFLYISFYRVVHVYG